MNMKLGTQEVLDGAHRSGSLLVITCMIHLLVLLTQLDVFVKTLVSKTRKALLITTRHSGISWQTARATGSRCIGCMIPSNHHLDINLLTTSTTLNVPVERVCAQIILTESAEKDAALVPSGSRPMLWAQGASPIGQLCPRSDHVIVVPSFLSPNTGASTRTTLRPAGCVYLCTRILDRI